MVEARHRYGGSKVGRLRGRNWIQGARGIIQIVLCAGYFDIRFGCGAILPVGRYRRPWRREGAGIFNGKQHFKRIRIEQVIALDHVDFVRMRRTGAVHPAVSPKAGVLAAQDKPSGNDFAHGRFLPFIPRHYGRPPGHRSCTIQTYTTLPLSNLIVAPQPRSRASSAWVLEGTRVSTSTRIAAAVAVLFNYGSSFNGPKPLGGRRCFVPAS
jgi:hypothetical protein